MKGLRPLVVAGALIVSLAGAGHAADYSTLPPPATYMPPVAPSYEQRDVFMSGWYLRGDAGYRWGVMTAAATSTGADPTVDSSGNATMVGLGAGFHMLKWMRLDFTVDYATPQSFRGTSVTPGDVTAKIQSTTGLVNLYADLGTWYRFTPYVGAGIGTARVVTSDFQGPVPPGSGAASHAQWNLAWAVMAGTAFALSQNMQVDVGYRYLSMNDAHTADGVGGNTTFRNLGAHEVRIGLRWNLDDLDVH